MAKIIVRVEMSKEEFDKDFMNYLNESGSFDTDDLIYEGFKGVKNMSLEEKVRFGKYLPDTFSELTMVNKDWLGISNESIEVLGELKVGSKVFKNEID